MLVLEVAPPAGLPAFPPAPAPALLLLEPPPPGVPFPVAGSESPPPLPFDPLPPCEPLLPLEWPLFPQADARPTPISRANQDKLLLPGTLELVRIWNLPKVVPSWRSPAATGHPGPIAPYQFHTLVRVIGKQQIALSHTNRTCPYLDGEPQGGPRPWLRPPICRGVWPRSRRWYRSTRCSTWHPRCSSHRWQRSFGRFRIRRPPPVGIAGCR